MPITASELLHENILCVYKTKVRAGCFLDLPATLFCETDSPTKPELTVLASLASQETPEILQFLHPNAGAAGTSICTWI